MALSWGRPLPVAVEGVHFVGGRPDGSHSLTFSLFVIEQASRFVIAIRGKFRASVHYEYDQSIKHKETY